MKQNIAILDYGIGNLISVKKAIEYVGGTPIISSNFDKLLSCDKLILPGVGAYAKGMYLLNKRGLKNLVYEFIKTGKPIMGICLGMQLLFQESEEFGFTSGLGVLEGKIVSIKKNSKDKTIKIPHISWSELYFERGRENNILLCGIKKKDQVYFVHSYGVDYKTTDTIISSVYYYDIKIAAIVQKNNVFGCQFHPERSGEVGLKILENFLNID